MPECRCRTEAANYWKKSRCRTNFSLAFRHLHIIFQYHKARITQLADVYGRSGCITFHYLQFERALGIPFTTNNSFFKCRNVGLSGIQSVRYRNEQKFRCQNAPVPDWDTGSRNADAGGIDLDADAQLWHVQNCLCYLSKEGNGSNFFKQRSHEHGYLSIYLFCGVAL